MPESNRILSIAATQIGTEEQPPNSNTVKYNTAFYGREISGSGYAWCCAFVWWVFQQAQAAGLFFGGKKTASCTELYHYYRDQGRTVPAEQAQAGDLVFYVFDGNKTGTMNHIGICEACADGYVTTIDGNTSTESDANGGAVMRRKRALKYVGGVARPNYEEAEAMTQDQFVALYDAVNPLYTSLEQVPDYWREDAKALVATGAIQGDGTHPIAIRREQLQGVVISKRYAEQHKG